MPQWAGSCWYYLRYLQPWNAEQPVDPEVEKYWLPVDLYVGEQPCCQDTFCRRCVACSFSMVVTEQQAVRSRGPYLQEWTWPKAITYYAGSLLGFRFYILMLCPTRLYEVHVMGGISNA